MSEILFQYEKVNPTTWVYLSSLLMIGLFFQFNRFWTVRNLDLVLLILLAPGLLMVNEAREATSSLETAPPETTFQMAATGAPADSAHPLTSRGDAPASSRRHMAYVGYLWLFAVSLVWLARLLVD